MTNQQWLEHTYQELVRYSQAKEPFRLDALCREVAVAISEGELGWTTVQKICKLIAAAEEK